jgi:hypothetical protein
MSKNTERTIWDWFLSQAKNVPITTGILRMGKFFGECKESGLAGKIRGLIWHQDIRRSSNSGQQVGGGFRALGQIE